MGLGRTRDRPPRSFPAHSGGLVPRHSSVKSGQLTLKSVRALVFRVPVCIRVVFPFFAGPINILYCPMTTRTKMFAPLKVSSRYKLQPSAKITRVRVGTHWGLGGVHGFVILSLLVNVFLRRHHRRRGMFGLLSPRETLRSFSCIRSGRRPSSILSLQRLSFSSGASGNGNRRGG